MSRDIPILFSAPMVRANLRDVDPKTQTRRIVKPPNGYVLPSGDTWDSMDDWGYKVEKKPDWHGDTIHHVNYAETGDRLWVRETWRKACAHEDDDTLCIAYRAAQEEGRGGLIVNNIPRPAHVERWEEEDAVWRPSIFMPRWASRTTLLVKDWRIERLQAISEDDAIAEGVERHPHHGWSSYHQDTIPQGTAIDSYACLWKSINGVDSWKANPWVWVITYERIKP